MHANAWDFISHMIEDCEDIVNITQSKNFKQFANDRGLQKIVIYSLLNLGELMKNFSETEKADLSNIPWKSIIKFRNVAAHGYHNLQLPLVWSIATKRIPPLLIELQKKSDELAEQAELAEKAKLAEIAKQVEIAEQAKLAKKAEIAEKAKLAEQAENPKNPPTE